MKNKNNGDNRWERGQFWVGVVTAIIALVALLFSYQANEKAESANALAKKNNDQMILDSVAAYKGIMVVNQSITVKKKAGFICNQTRDVMCLYTILLNDGNDNFDKTIEVFFPIEILNTRQSAIFSVTISNEGLDDEFFVENKKIFDDNSKLKLGVEKTHNFSNVDDKSSLEKLNLYEEIIGDNYNEGFAIYKYNDKVSTGQTMTIEIPYINVHYPKINGEEVILLEIHRGYFDIAFLTATYNNDDSNYEMGIPSVMKIPLNYSYMDYNKEIHEGEIEVIITISVNRKFEEKNEYEFIIEMEYNNITSRMKITR